LEQVACEGSFLTWLRSQWGVVFVGWLQDAAGARDPEPSPQIHKLDEWPIVRATGAEVGVRVGTYVTTTQASSDALALRRDGDLSGFAFCPRRGRVGFSTPLAAAVRAGWRTVRTRAEGPGRAAARARDTTTCRVPSSSGRSGHLSGREVKIDCDLCDGFPELRSAVLVCVCRPVPLKHLRTGTVIRGHRQDEDGVALGNSRTSQDSTR
jgi:hypothetical protein